MEKTESKNIEDDGIDPLEAARQIWKGKWIILASSLAFFVIAYIGTTILQQNGKFVPAKEFLVKFNINEKALQLLDHKEALALGWESEVDPIELQITIKGIFSDSFSQNEEIMLLRKNLLEKIRSNLGNAKLKLSNDLSLLLDEAEEYVRILVPLTKLELNNDLSLLLDEISEYAQILEPLKLVKQETLEKIDSQNDSNINFIEKNSSLSTFFTHNFDADLRLDLRLQMEMTKMLLDMSQNTKDLFKKTKYHLNLIQSLPYPVEKELSEISPDSWQNELKSLIKMKKVLAKLETFQPETWFTLVTEEEADRIKSSVTYQVVQISYILDLIKKLPYPITEVSGLQSKLKSLIKMKEEISEIEKIPQKNWIALVDEEPSNRVRSTYLNLLIQISSVALIFGAFIGIIFVVNRENFSAIRSNLGKL